ncbi:DUF4163 domain-containing protein [Croceicoccus sp. F390]|uniref:DUF4163 domain-containing protein n=1 Tax=Croceicoccus esteveae TaxID=3075597 RepID=A0ABU2ZH16_9SPHN|nr:DUF4163 domain-containing protein [Croceicoccus sp. F390]MDT0575670.1 DUF4163 domain-containing protein [Croceicoccus sp. F390]
MRIAIVSALLLLSACGTQTAGNVEAAGGADAVEGSATAGDAQAVKEDNALYEFAYSWPAAAGKIAPVAAILTTERTRLKNELTNDAEAAKAEMDASGFPYRTYAMDKSWQVVTDTPRFLSLSATQYSYSGGAHGMTVSDALLWDRKAQEAIKPIDVFTSSAKLDAATQDAFCTALDRQRAAKRDEPVRRSDDPFSDCIEPVANSTVILGSTNGSAIDRIGFLIAPYNAGPYAEGSYEVTLPVTDRILDAVKPAYRDAFVAR